MEMTRCLLHEKGMPKNIWVEDANTAVFLLNRLPTKALQKKTPFVAWVTCNSKRQRVVAFVLPDLQLRGTISLSLANLSFLRVLNLENNSFHGSVNYELGHLPHLRVIDIQNNQLQGSIPTSLFQHQRVQIISLAFNELSGEMWNGLWYVPELRVLNPSNNSLTSIIRPAVGNATKLLNFSSIPATLFNISSLLTISLSFNSLSGPLMLDEENIVSNLKIISLAKNKFSGCIPSNICQLTELKVLSISFNNITGKIPKNIGCLPKLKMFYIGQILKAIFNISTLEAIAFSFNNLSGRIPTTTGLHHLKFLLLGNNQIEGEIPLFIANASKLEILELANNFLTETIPINLGNLQELRILILHDNLPTNELRECELRFFNSLTDCRILQYLDVGSNLLNGVLPNSIGNLSSTIELIHLGDAHISGFIPTSIGNMSGLSALVFEQNHLMENIPPEIEGEVPSDIGKLKALIYLDLSANHFSGMIPTTLGELQNLEFLDLSNNSFSGPIPLSFVNLIILEFLGLSLNALSGTIPKSLEKLSRLTSINVSFNDLEGEMPSGGMILLTFPREWYSTDSRDAKATSGLGIPERISITNFPKVPKKVRQESVPRSVVVKTELANPLPGEDPVGGVKHGEVEGNVTPISLDERSSKGLG
ncbi:hypothetical protein CQW23_08623 [Capsicum baccatum]|uniref:LRR receptor-like serine/threonine-protein kinase n=1 Tax=Capsicum baccatum TaxID=33114 RepID=A0A2G2X9Y6_CAPBA|nr:hypothetical protein CQW23_08623 [Capsicum baccatum]